MKTSRRFIFAILCVLSLGWIALTSSAASYTYYATADSSKDPNVSNDCLTPETAGYYPNAFKKFYGVSGGSTSTLILEDGDYNMEPITNYTDSGVSYVLYLDWHKENCVFNIKSASGNPENCRLIGMADRQLNHRFTFVNRNNITLYADGIQFTNFYGQGALVYYNANYNSLMNFSNCVFRANGMKAGINGGCFYSNKAASRIICRNCTFENNEGSFGGVIYNSLSMNWQFIACRFMGNQAIRNPSAATPHQTGAGGVFYGYGSFSNCTFIANAALGAHEANGAGGVAYCKAGAGTFEDCYFTANSNGYATVVRGYNNDATKVVLRRCHFDNSSQQNLMIYTATCEDCYFTENGIIGGGSSVFKNSLFYKNNQKAGKYSFFDNCKLYNCTVISNTTHNAAGSDDWHNSPFGIGNKVYDSLILDNAGMYGLSGADTKASANCFSNCVYNGSVNYSPSAGIADNCVKVTGGVAAMYLQQKGDHIFVPKGKEHRLVNRALNYAGFTAADKDLAGKSRLVGDAVDIGCYEWDGKSPGLKVIIR